jgi:hypothetical protein
VDLARATMELSSHGQCPFLCPEKKEKKEVSSHSD